MPQPQPKQSTLNSILDEPQPQPPPPPPQPQPEQSILSTILEESDPVANSNITNENLTEALGSNLSFLPFILIHNFFSK